MTGRPPEDPVKRFWRRVKKTRGCWLYQGHQQKRGYCQFWTPEDGVIYAHIFSFKLHGGKLTKRKPLVCHTCDVGNCVRPSHLWAGSQKENIADMIAKGRKPLLVGERNGMFGRKSLGFTGRNHTIKSRKKMARSQTGRKHSEETRSKMSLNHGRWNLGKKLSAGHREKIRLGNIRRWRREKRS